MFYLSFRQTRREKSKRRETELETLFYFKVVKTYTICNNYLKKIYNNCSNGKQHFATTQPFPGHILLHSFMFHYYLRTLCAHTLVWEKNEKET